MAESGKHEREGSSVRWDDLEVFGVLAAGLRLGKTLQQVAEDPVSTSGGPRMVYFRLGRLEQAFGRRLVDRRPWGREARLTSGGEIVAAFAMDLLSARKSLLDQLSVPDVPVLRVAARATLISTLLPHAVGKQPRERSRDHAFHLELVLVNSYAEALTAVNEGRVDIGLYLFFRGFDRAVTPRNVSREILGKTDVVVLCPRDHRFATRSRGRRVVPVHIDELVDETVIVRGYVDARLIPPGPRGRRIIVPHSLDKLAYVRLGAGVSPLPRLAYELLGPPTGVAAVPLVPPVTALLIFLRPRKRLRRLTFGAEQFIEELRLACRRLVRRHERL